MTKMVMMRAQKPCVITAMGFAVLSLGLFTNVIRYQAQVLLLKLIVLNIVSDHDFRLVIFYVTANLAGVKSLGQFYVNCYYNTL